jgi:CDP-4-dehydro-6-deoxyglucose reductase, E3
MTQWLTLSRAARLIGVPRGALQRHVREGRLQSNDGLVSTEGLARLYPAWTAEDSGAFERVARVKEEAFGRRVQERVLPAQDVLAQRLFAQSRELADARRHLSRYHALVVALQERLEALAAAAPSPALDELRARMERGLADVLATESADPLTVMDDVLKVMSAQVTVRPSGRVFFVEGRDSLLQAGLKAGLKLNYGCGNGTCGLCKARVVEGAVAKTMPFDYPLSEAERLQGHTLLCAHSAASGEIVIETLEARGPGEIPEQEIMVRVRAVQPLGRDTLLLHLQTPRTSRLRFLAGQSVTLYGGSESVDAHATYPVASCPCDDRNLHFHVGRDDADAFAALLHGGAIRPGDAVRLWGPVGDFVLAESERPLAFVACDTGFAPVKSLIEHAMATDATESISLDWLALRADGHYLANQCRAWAAVCGA